MLERRTYHQCAVELEYVCRQFRDAYLNKRPLTPAQRDYIMRDTSVQGIEILRILALSIRSDQDAGLTARRTAAVGAFRPAVTDAEAADFAASYGPPYSSLSGYEPLYLRQALNKVAHFDPRRGGFFADDNTHDLILVGQDYGETWIAVVSLLDLCRVVKGLPDAALNR